MTGRVRLMPMLGMVLLAGCTPASGDGANAANSVQPSTDGAVPDNIAVNATAPAPANASVKVEPPLPAETQPAAPAADQAHPLDLPASNDAAQADPFPDEVTAFMVDRDGCDHFRGEEPYDKERRAYLEESIAELCTGTDARLAVLKQRYARDKAVMAALGQYEDRIEEKGAP